MESILDINVQSSNEDDLCIWPVSVHINSACNLVIWSTSAESSLNVNWNEVKKQIAVVMDRLADLLHDYQFFAPLVALVEIHDESSQWEMLMGDQDWHRGRFVLQGIKKYRSESVEKARTRWQGPLSTAQYKPRRVSSEDFARSIEVTLESVRVPNGVEKQLFARYSDNLKVAVESGQTEEMTIAWEDELLNDINSLLGRSILEVPRFDQ